MPLTNSLEEMFCTKIIQEYCKDAFLKSVMVNDLTDNEEIFL